MGQIISHVLNWTNNDRNKVQVMRAQENSVIQKELENHHTLDEIEMEKHDIERRQKNTQFVQQKLDLNYNEVDTPLVSDPVFECHPNQKLYKSRYKYKVSKLLQYIYSKRRKYSSYEIFKRRIDEELYLFPEVHKYQENERSHVYYIFPNKEVMDKFKKHMLEIHPTIDSYRKYTSDYIAKLVKKDNSLLEGPSQVYRISDIIGSAMPLECTRNSAIYSFIRRAIQELKINPISTDAKNREYLLPKKIVEKIVQITMHNYYKDIEEMQASQTTTVESKPAEEVVVTEPVQEPVVVEPVQEVVVEEANVSNTDSIDSITRKSIMEFANILNNIANQQNIDITNFEHHIGKNSIQLMLTFSDNNK